MNYALKLLEKFFLGKVEYFIATSVTKDLTTIHRTIKLKVVLSMGRGTYQRISALFISQKQICEDWMLPRATVNTLIKECEASGYVTLQSIPGRKRELQICLTEARAAYTRKALKDVYEAEESALKETLSQCSSSFIGLGVVLALFGIIFMRPIAVLLGANGNTYSCFSMGLFGTAFATALSQVVGAVVALIVTAICFVIKRMFRWRFIHINGIMTILQAGS